MSEESIAAKLEDLLNSLGPDPQMPGALNILCGQSLPIVLSFRLLKLVHAVNLELEQYQAARKLLCERFAKKDEEGKAIMVSHDGSPLVEGQPGKYDIPDDKMPEFNKELQTLLATEVSIPGKQIKVLELSSVRMAPAHLMALEWLVVEA